MAATAEPVPPLRRLHRVGSGTISLNIPSEVARRLHLTPGMVVALRDTRDGVEVVPVDVWLRGGRR